MSYMIDMIARIFSMQTSVTIPVICLIDGQDVGNGQENPNE